MTSHIIFVHGRNKKPWTRSQPVDFQHPGQIAEAGEGLRQLWLRCFLKGLERHGSAATLRYWRRHESKRVHMAYYGDVLNILNSNGAPEPDGYLDEYDSTLDDLFQRTKSGRRQRYKGFRKDPLLSLGAFLSQGLGFKDEVLLAKLPDLKAYHKEHSTASAIRRRLHQHLDKLLKGRHRVAIVGHSLGSLVAYDVLWKISHRSEYAALAEHKVDLFVSLGSPLGNQAFLNLFTLDCDYDADHRFPRNIESWHNLSATGDFVAHDARLRNDFKKRKFLRHLGAGGLVDHVGLYNPYHNREGSWNPHKVFGYLLQPSLAKAIDTFTESAEG